MIYCVAVIRYLKLVAVDGSTYFCFFLHWSTFFFLHFTDIYSHDFSSCRRRTKNNNEFETRFVVKSERRRQYQSRRRAIQIKAKKRKKTVQSDESTERQANWMQKNICWFRSTAFYLSLCSSLHLACHFDGWFYLIIMKENSNSITFFEKRKYSDDDEQQKQRKTITQNYWDWMKNRRKRCK